MLFVVAALVILACRGALRRGAGADRQALGVDEFLLVQWVAPLASEAPELIVACLYAWRLNAADSARAPCCRPRSTSGRCWWARSRSCSRVSAGTRTACRSTPSSGELLLTAAQSLFAVSILITLALTTRGALALFVLFAVQFFGSLMLDAEADRILNIALSGVYVALAVVQFVRQRHLLARTVRDGIHTSFDELEELDEEELSQDGPRDRPARDRKSP